MYNRQVVSHRLIPLFGDAANCCMRIWSALS